MNTLILIVVVIAFVFLISIVVKARKRFIKGNALKTIMVVYGAILLALPLVLYALPDKDFLQPDGEETEVLNQAHMAFEQFHNLASQGKLAEAPEGIRINKSVRFPFEGDELNLTNLPQQSRYEYPAIAGSYGSIWVEKSAKEGIIEVDSYITTHLVEGVDVTEMILPPEIAFSDNKLKITAPSHYALEFASFMPDLTAAQFTSNPPPYQFGSNTTFFGNQAIYLRVPENVTINAKEQFNIIYVKRNNPIP